MVFIIAIFQQNVCKICGFQCTWETYYCHCTMRLKLKDGEIPSSGKVPIKFIWKWMWGKWDDKRQPLRWHTSLDRVVAQIITRMKAMWWKQREMFVNLSPQCFFFVIYIKFHVLIGWQPAPHFSGSSFIISSANLLYMEWFWNFWRWPECLRRWLVQLPAGQFWEACSHTCLYSLYLLRAEQSKVYWFCKTTQRSICWNYRNCGTFSPNKFQCHIYMYQCAWHFHSKFCIIFETHVR